MKIVAALFLCLLITFTAFGQTSETEIGVEEITTFRDDGSGKAGIESETFLTTDIPIHYSILLNFPKSVTVKMVIVAVKAAGLKPESKLITVSYKTGEKENRVNFTASPDKFWAAGNYRADIFLDGKLSKSKEFEIAKTAAK